MRQLMLLPDAADAALLPRDDYLMRALLMLFAMLRCVYGVC